MRAALAAGQTPVETHQDGAYTMKSSVGTLKLAHGPRVLSMPRAAIGAQKLVLSVEEVKALLRVLDANYVSSLQAVYPEMLGITLGDQGVYSVALQAVVCGTPGQFLTGGTGLLPEPFLRVIQIALDGYQGNAPVILYRTPERVQATFGRVTFGSALPEVKQWLDLKKVTGQLTAPPLASPLDLSPLLERQNLFTLTHPEHLELGPNGVRAVSATSEYTWEGLTTPTAFKLPFAKLMKLLPITPELVRLSPTLVELRGKDATAYLSTL